MLEKVEKYIKENGLLQRGEKVIVGVSGGADSVCLLHILHRLRETWDIHITAAHLNHKIRDEADEDEEYVKALCQGLNIPFAAKKEDITALSKERGISEELCGREERYRFFSALAKENGAEKIAVAHNKNDLAETVLMCLLRGSGARGLSGIQPVREEKTPSPGENRPPSGGEPPRPSGALKIIRPLLDIKRREIEDYCAENALLPRVDKTNFLPIYLRNKIRLSLLPEFLKLNPNFLNTAAQSAKILSDEDNYLSLVSKKEYERLARPADNGIYFPAGELLKLHKAVVRRVLRLAAPCIGPFHADGIIGLLKDGGKRLQLPGGYFARNERGRLYIEKPREEYKKYEYPLQREGSFRIPETGKTIETAPTGGMPVKVPKGARLAVRQKRDGDIFFPEGMQGRKKVKDFFIDKKIPRQNRGAVPIITVDGEIALICGLRRDRRFVPAPGDERVCISFK